MPGEGRRRNSEDEQEQGKTSQQLALATSGGFNEGTPASGMELDLPRVRGAHGEGGGAGSSGAKKGTNKAFIQFTKSTFDGRGCTLVSMMNGNGTRDLFCKEQRKKQPG